MVVEKRPYLQGILKVALIISGVSYRTNPSLSDLGLGYGEGANEGGQVVESGNITGDCWILVTVIGLVGLIMGVMVALLYSSFIPRK